MDLSHSSCVIFNFDANKSKVVAYENISCSIICLDKIIDDLFKNFQIKHIQYSQYRHIYDFGNLIPAKVNWDLQHCKK